MGVFYCSSSLTITKRFMVVRSRFLYCVGRVMLIYSWVVSSLENVGSRCAFILSFGLKLFFGSFEVRNARILVWSFSFVMVNFVGSNCILFF